MSLTMDLFGYIQQGIHKSCN